MPISLTGLLSYGSLLANVVLHELDCELERRGHSFVRYADDLIILVRHRKAGERVLASIQRFLETKLRLELNDSKSPLLRWTVANSSALLFEARKFAGATKPNASSVAESKS